MLFLVFVWSLYGQDFPTFMQTALQNSPYLKANALDLERANEQSKIIQRYQNPTLSLEISEFDQNIGGRDIGYRGAFTQPIRLWGVGDARDNLATATRKEAKSFVTLRRADFVKRLSLLYIEYVKQNALVKLAQEELTIAQTIAHISRERYKAGTIAKARYLLAKVDVINAKNRLNEKKADKLSAYLRVLEFSGILEEITLDTHYHFTQSSLADVNNSASVQFLQNTQQKALKEAQLNANKIEWINVYAEYEKEPEQKMIRGGVDIPLAIFNTKKEENRLAALKAKQSAYLVQNQKTLLANRLKRIDLQLNVLRKVLDSTQTLYKAQKELLGMYEDGYKIANVNLIELQNIKNNLIQTKEKEITLHAKIDTNIVEYNYETGAYNE